MSAQRGTRVGKTTDARVGFTVGEMVKSIEKISGSTPSCAVGKRYAYLR